MRIVIVTQARTGSTRLPNKVLKEIKGESLLKIHLSRLKQSKLATDILVATTVKKDDDAIIDLAEEMNVLHFKGDEKDVLDRIYKSIEQIIPDFIVRVTSDCPLIDPVLIDEVINTAIVENVDYCSNVLQETFPDGQDIEVVKFSALKSAWEQAVLKSDREHVTPFIRRNSTFNSEDKYSAFSYELDESKYKDIRMTVDELADFKVMELLIHKLGTAQDWKKYADLYLSEKSVSGLNESILRNEGYIKSLKKDNE